MKNIYTVSTGIALGGSIIGALFLIVRFDVQWLLAYFIALNIITLIYYAYDKSISPTNMTRIPERTLHTLALIGGSPAALLGQKLFRHKTAKTSFQLVHWIILLVQIALIAWFAYEKYFVQ